MAFSLTGCTKLMREDESEPARIDSKEKMINALTGAYDRFKYIFINYDDYVINFCQVPITNADDFNHSYYYAPNYTFVDHNWKYLCDINNTSAYEGRLFNYGNVAEPWFDIYKTIVSLNNIIIQFENKTNISLEMKELLGEAYLMRGYAYFRLVRIYGEVPLIKNTQVNYTIAKSSVEEVYNFVESDILAAASMLPANCEEARVPHATPHRGTAKAVLAEVYLSRAGYPLKQNEYYAKAADMAGEVIDSAAFFGFGLMPDYADLWLGKHPWNEESILVLYINGYGPIGDHGNSNAYFSTVYSRDSIYPSPFAVEETYVPGKKFYNKYPMSYRKKVNFANLSTKPTLMYYYGINEYTFVELPDSMDLCTLINYNKFDVVFNPSPFEKFNTDTDFQANDNFKRLGFDYLYIYRYAQTLLTYAEAKARSGQPDASAYEAVNMIRRRANKVDIHSPSIYDLKAGLSSKQFTDSIVWERALELCAEPEGRWFDLVRLEMVEGLPQLRDPDDMLDYPSIITKDFYFRPIPESEKNFNPNLE